MARPGLARTHALVDEADHGRRVREFREALAVVAGPKHLLSALQTAEFLGVSRAHVYDLMSAGELPYIELGGTKRIPVAWLAEWLAAGGTRDDEQATVSPFPVRGRRGGVRSVRRWAR
ncbi:MAG TPA: helix-turn-helix domain-containing protein [Solirubrobacteraceae bacterium]|nr:helix-turn-helix domain-containing protein [Solirubrobacteraceae bacterium]